MAITNVTALAPGIEDGEHFEAEVDGVKITFSPVGRCPGTTKSDTGYHRICHGVWWDYQYRRGYRFCPKTPDALTGLTERLWEDILRHVGDQRKEQRQRAEHDADRRRRVAADDLLTFVEGIDWTVIEPAVLKNAVRKATLAIKNDWPKGLEADGSHLVTCGYCPEKFECGCGKPEQPHMCDRCDSAAEESKMIQLDGDPGEMAAEAAIAADSQDQEDLPW